jgi:O-acetyl-ADP-ribose deacetylase (regulator of RNase III)
MSEARRKFANTWVELVLGDITQQTVDAIVNAANSSLAGGGGVDGAIHRAGGAAIMQETRVKYPNGCPTGCAVLTAAGNLSARFIIHAVGPVWHGGNSGEPELLASAYRACLRLADEQQLQSIAFPSISTGAYGYPMNRAAEVAIRTVANYVAAGATSLQLVRMVLFGSDALRAYEREMQSLR